ncbi:mpv17-like protein isoform X1 [Macaca fascicularis]|uniref:mpv17-like protein isoform X1 n=1 Tax=Macaca fascicularis TaxID=9541 RepID=UPI003D15A0C2
MAGWWPALSRAARRHPWPTNVLLYGSLFSAGDALQQRLQGREADWRQTRRVATLAVTFHANFNYVWLGLLERALPGRAPRAVLAKLLWDQVVGAPIVVSAFYTGMSILQEKDDIFLDLKQKFWNTYLSGLVYWPFVQVSSAYSVLLTQGFGFHVALTNSLSLFQLFLFNGEQLTLESVVFSGPSSSVFPSRVVTAH